MDKPLIKVLLSTYNGERYLKEQIDSVLSQNGVTVRLIIRDDGSNDGTLKLLREYSTNYSCIELIEGQNIGCSKSFFNLMSSAFEDDVDYYAFCDQDDVWHPDKLSVAIEKLKIHDKTPSLYCSNLKVVNEYGEFLRFMYSSNTKPNKNFSLLSNIATGCTCVINQNLLKLFINHDLPKDAVMHDWWFYCLACFYGNVIFDSDAYISYRQHSNNVYGARSKSYLVKSINFLKSLVNSDKEHYRERQAKEFLHSSYSALSNKDKKIVDVIANYRTNLFTRLRLTFSREIIPGISYPLRLRILLGLI